MLKNGFHTLTSPLACDSLQFTHQRLSHLPNLFDIGKTSAKDDKEYWQGCHCNLE